MTEPTLEEIKEMWGGMGKVSNPEVWWLIAQLETAISLIEQAAKPQNETGYLAYIDERREFLERVKKT